MILTQAQIEAETRSKWGGKTNANSAQLLTKSLNSFEEFVHGAMALYPDGALIPYIGKEFVPVAHKDGACCTHVHTSDKATFSPQMISGLERSFRNLFGDSIANALLNMSARWALAMFGDSGAVSNSGYWAGAYYTQLSDTFQSSYTEMMQPSIWDQLKKRAAGLGADLVPPMPLVVTDGAPWIKDIFANGFELVTSKITKLHLPTCQQIMLDGFKQNLTAKEIAANMQAQLGGDAYHWTRLVRSEMIDASQRAKIEQAQEMEGVNIIWVASRMGATCPICIERNGKVFDPRKMNEAGYFATDETVKLDTKRDLKIGRYPHPQCRCSLAYTVRPANWP